MEVDVIVVGAADRGAITTIFPAEILLLTPLFFEISKNCKFRPSQRRLRTGDWYSFWEFIQWHAMDSAMT
jgi:hypothetical protein